MPNMCCGATLQTMRTEPRDAAVNVLIETRAEQLRAEHELAQCLDLWLRCAGAAGRVQAHQRSVPIGRPRQVGIRDVA